MSERLKQVLDKFEVEPGLCWQWTGHIDESGGGYGRVMVNYTRHQAHRLVYEELVGPIPDGMQLDHLCRNRACVNPDHLEPVTCRQNLLRGATNAAENATKTHCVNGHEFNERNTYWRRREGGGRACRACARESARRYRGRRP